MFKSFLTFISQILPPPAWEKIELAGAYFSGKGSGSNALRAEVKAASRFMKGRAPGDGLVIFDVGANKGDWTHEALKVFGPRVQKIYQFEPSAHNIKLLKERFRGDPRIILVPSAASDKKGSAELFSNQPGSGIASLHKRNLEHFGVSMNDAARVTTVRVDDVIAEQRIAQVDFMKMDIEGHELAALRGAERSLKNGVIRAFSFEFGGANIDSRTYFQDFWYFLTPLGYSIFRILPNGSVLRIEKYNEGSEYFRTTNYVAALEKLRD